MIEEHRYPGTLFEQIVAHATAENGMTEIVSERWPALKKWYEETFVQNCAITSCVHWRPGEEGYVTLDAIIPEFRSKILCYICFCVIAEEMSDIGLAGDYTCNMCGTEPEDHQFADVVIALGYNVIIVGQACHACLDSQTPKEQRQ